jgi:hypothetical protein
MTIYPLVTVESIRSGVAARTPEIGLAGHGRDTSRAVASVSSIVGIWARTLQGAGELELTLARLGIEYSAAGRGIVIEPAVSGVTA